MAMERYIATDVLVEILRRLPPSSLRLSRLVCRRWRDVVNEHTTEMQSRPSPLFWDGHVAYIVDLSPESTGLRKELWRTRSNNNGLHPQLVGTCNGLLCFCDNQEQPGGSLTVVNPVTGEMLPLPALPCASYTVGRHNWVSWHTAYNFAYHPTTGKYKVVHVPCSYRRLCEFGTVQVLTLGETTWRDVTPPVGDTRCKFSAGIISIDGMTYWVKLGGSTSIVSFDLSAEYFASAATPLPRLSAEHRGYHLVEVRGRLGFVSLPDVWVLKQGSRKWGHLYRIKEDIPRPHFVFGDCILTRTRRINSELYGHWLKSSTRLERCGVVHIGHRDHGTLVAKRVGYRGRFVETIELVAHYRTFAYVETIEPLYVYATN